MSRPDAKQTGGLQYNLRCEVCDLAWELGKSEEQFYREFGKLEREQLLATFISKRKRTNVMVLFPSRDK